MEGQVQELGLGLFGVSWEFARDVDLGAAGDEGEDRGGDELVGEDEGGGMDVMVGC